MTDDRKPSETARPTRGRGTALTELERIARLEEQALAAFEARREMRKEMRSVSDRLGAIETITGRQDERTKDMEHKLSVIERVSIGILVPVVLMFLGAVTSVILIVSKGGLSP